MLDEVLYDEQLLADPDRALDGVTRLGWQKQSPYIVFDRGSVRLAVPVRLVGACLVIVFQLIKPGADAEGPLPVREALRQPTLLKAVRE